MFYVVLNCGYACFGCFAVFVVVYLIIGVWFWIVWLRLCFIVAGVFVGVAGGLGIRCWWVVCVAGVYCFWVCYVCGVVLYVCLVWGCLLLYVGGLWGIAL